MPVSSRLRQSSENYSGDWSFVGWSNVQCIIFLLFIKMYKLEFYLGELRISRNCAEINYRV